MAYTATDREQIEELKKWWNEYGKAIAIAVIVGLFIGFAWRYWHIYVAAKETAASEIYQSMGQASLLKQEGVVAQDALQLQSQYSKTVYASLASFLQAQVAVSQGHYVDADTSLIWVMNHSQNSAFQQIARIRDARVLLQLSKLDQAMNVISTVSDGAYQPMIDEVKAEIYAAQGNNKKAADLFQTAKAGYDLAGISNPLLNLKVAN